ncbi:apextrin-like protein 1 [Elysia marginata]|uniref:Apextrin-like protein 1 n=1 Tax=Elysia marginata TaxID=1093978 RepID=A0AAV4IK97_9GAST|nr:apextrin-like protein 1 [Elysia marginata]
MILYQVRFFAFLLVLHRGLTLPVQDVSDPSMPFQVTLTPALVNRYTAKEMSLRCERNPSVPTKLAEIYRMRIVKQSTSGWDLVAEQRELLASPTVIENVTASANIRGAITDVFLEVTWNTIGPQCFGVFKCQVMGFDDKDEVLTERSSTLEVYEFKNFIHHLIVLSVDSKEKLLEMKNFTDTEIARLNSGFQRLEKSVEENKKRLSRLETMFPPWPTGNYALLKPKDGCPADPVFSGGNQAFLKLHTQSQSSSDPPDSHSSAFPSETKSTVDSKKFVTLKFCEVTMQQVDTMGWPQGSFCINKLVGKSCPYGFSEGKVCFDAEDTDYSGQYSANVASNGRDPHLHFCCQNSTSADVPIQLPTFSPFLLYRYGGACQAVQGMSVSEEYVQINTEDSSNGDTLYSSHPDLDQPGDSVIKLNLCYYTKL